MQAIDSCEQLSSLTKNRVRPPSNRRPPSRQRSSSPSPQHHHKDSSSSPPLPPLSTARTGSIRQEAVTRVGGITGISADSAMVAGEPWPELDAATIKLQWVNECTNILLIVIMSTNSHISYSNGLT